MSGNLGDPACLPACFAGLGTGLSTPGPRLGNLDRRERTTGAPRGIAGRRQRSPARGARGVAQRCSTCEAGELASKDPVEERALHTGGPSEGNQGEHFEASSPVTVTSLDSVRGARPHGRAVNPSVDEPDALIAHVRICGSAREQSLARLGPCPPCPPRVPFCFFHKGVEQ